MDTFDYKPELYPLDGKTIKVRTFGRGGKRNESRVVGPKWKFKPYGDCGKYVSDLFPHIGSCVDDIAFLHSMKAESPIHGSAMLMMNAGNLLSGHPSLGSWVNYGLGSVNENLPGYVVMLDKTGGPISGAKNWSSGYMPASFQGTVLRSQGSPILDLENSHGIPAHNSAPCLTILEQSMRDICRNDMIIPIYQPVLLPTNLRTRCRHPLRKQWMWTVNRNMLKTSTEWMVPILKISAGNAACPPFGGRGVRFIQIYSGGHHNDNNWDAHGDLVKNHSYHAGNTDKPIAGLLKDLKQRGLLDETLVVWGGEFGRQPTAEYAEGTGRDHNSYGFTMWMAGGGIKEESVLVRPMNWAAKPRLTVFM